MDRSTQSAMEVIGGLAQLKSFVSMVFPHCKDLLKNNGHDFNDIQLELEHLCHTLDMAYKQAVDIENRLIKRMREPARH